MRVLLYLYGRNLVNLLKLTLSSPKRLIPAVVIAFWFLISLSSMIVPMSVPRNVNISESIPTDILYVIWSIVFVILAPVSCYFIQRAFHEGTLVFSLPEIDFICPTPLPRRDVLTLKLAQTYFWTVLGCLVVSFIGTMFVMIASPSQFFSSLMRSTAALSCYSIIMINLCNLVNLAVAGKPDKNSRLEWISKGCFYALLAFTMGSVLSLYAKSHDIQMALTGGIRNPLLMLAFFPLKWTLDFVFRIGPSSLHASIMCLLAVGTFVLVIRRKENPYEPSLGVSTRYAAMRAAARSGHQFKLSFSREKFKNKNFVGKTLVRPFGRGASAIIWKNLNIFTRTWMKTLFIILFFVELVLLLVRAIMPDMLTGEEVGYALCGLSGYGFMLTLTSLSVRFGRELGQVNILKPMPIPSWKIVIIQPITESVMFTGIVWIISILVAVTYAVPKGEFFFAYMIVLPFLVCAPLSLQTIVAILYPNISDYSQRLFAGLLSLVVILIGVLPPVGVGALLLAIQAPELLVIVATMAVALAIAAVGILGGSRMYERFDPTSD
jgi:hypothetical protein